MFRTSAFAVSSSQPNCVAVNRIVTRFKATISNTDIVALPYVFRSSIFKVIVAPINHCVRDHKNADLPAFVPGIDRRPAKSRTPQEKIKGYSRTGPAAATIAGPT
jgi:hypothetical protein